MSKPNRVAPPFSVHGLVLRRQLRFSEGLRMLTAKYKVAQRVYHSQLSPLHMEGDKQSPKSVEEGGKNARFCVQNAADCITRYGTIVRLTKKEKYISMFFISIGRLAWFAQRALQRSKVERSA